MTHKIFALLVLLVGFTGCSGDSFTDGTSPATAVDAPSIDAPQESESADALNNSDANDVKGFDAADSGGAEAETGTSGTGGGGSAGAGGSAGTGGISGTGGSAGTSGDSGACVPKTCVALGKNCGPTPDTCGGMITTCGSCPSTQTCAGGGTANVCGGCVPKTCTQAGIECGSIDDGCGNTVSCGTFRTTGDPGCPSGQHLWYCGFGYGKASGIPFPDCVKQGTTFPSAWCCHEAS